MKVTPVFQSGEWWGAEYEGVDETRASCAGAGNGKGTWKWEEVTLCCTIGERLENERTSNSKLITNIYPNPAMTAEPLTLQVKSENPMSIQVRLVNVVGDLFYDQTFDPEQLSDGIGLSGKRQMIQGIYFMMIRQGDQSITQRIIIKD